MELTASKGTDAPVLSVTFANWIAVVKTSNVPASTATKLSVASVCTSAKASPGTVEATTLAVVRTSSTGWPYTTTAALICVSVKCVKLGTVMLTLGVSNVSVVGVDNIVPLNTVDAPTFAGSTVVSLYAVSSITNRRSTTYSKLGSTVV